MVELRLEHLEHYDDIQGKHRCMLGAYSSCRMEIHY